LNLGVHPLGLPKLLIGRVAIPDRPTEYDCILRRRIEDAVPGEATSVFRSAIVSYESEEVIEALSTALPMAVSGWLGQWASFGRILSAKDSELTPLLAVVPILHTKAIAMLRTFCSVKLGDRASAALHLDEFLAASSPGCDFSTLDAYIRKLVARANSAQVEGGDVI
jgi:hypothetical protein